MRRNPTPRTIEKLRRYSLIEAMMPPGFSITPQMELSASFSCPKTPEAPISSVTIPMIVARTLCFVSLEAWISVWISRRALRPEEPLDLLIDLAAGCLFAENQARDRDRDNDQRRHGEDRVVGEGGAETQRAIGHPILETLHEKRTP